MSEDNSEQSSSNTISIRKDQLWKYSTFVLLALVVVVGLIAFSGNNGNAPTTGAAIGAPTAAGLAVVSASADDDARIGSPDAPVEIIEFSDFQCPFCSRAAPTVKQIIDEYGDDVTVVYRDFPLTSIHQMAQKSAEASECVREQGGDGAFWSFHDVLFANQGALSNDNLKKWASDEGYDISSCLDSGKFASEVQKDSRDGQAATCTGTPCFIVTGPDGKGQKVNGAVPFSSFKPIIDSMLT